MHQLLSWQVCSTVSLRLIAKTRALMLIHHFVTNPADSQSSIIQIVFSSMNTGPYLEAFIRTLSSTPVSPKAEMESWRICDREYTLTSTTFAKRQVLQSEYPNERAISNALFSRERLQNEYHALVYMGEHTSIPIPKVIEFVEQDGSLRLVTRRIHGVLLDDIEDEERYKSAVDSVTSQLLNNILPQLQKLRNNSVGSVSSQVPVIPPIEALDLSEQVGRIDWPRVRSGTPDFSFYHNDLVQHNIFVDPETFDIKGIIDWEYSGFFPPWFEAARWETRARDRSFSTMEEYAAKVIEFFNA